MPETSAQQCFKKRLRYSSTLFDAFSGFRIFIYPSRPVPDWGDKVSSGTGFLYKSASLCTIAWRAGFDNPMPELTLYPPPVTDKEFSFLAVVRFGSSPVRKLSLFFFLPVCRRSNFLTGRGMGPKNTMARSLFLSK
jgi:hypothetical protein